MYRFKNSSKTLVGLAFCIGVIALGYPQSSFGQKSGGQPPASPTASPQNVNVVNTPTVTLAPGTTVSVSGTPSVTISGTPNVAISGTPTVNVAAGTVLAYDQTTTVQQFGFTSLPQLDVSMFKEIRVVFTVNGAADYSLAPRIVNPNDAAEVVILDNLNQAQTGRGTKTYDILGQRIDFILAGSNFGAASVHVQVFGRSN
jgi:hypothetical protein